MAFPQFAELWKLIDLLVRKDFRQANLDGYSRETLKKVLIQYSIAMGDVKMLPETQLIFNIITTRMKEIETGTVPGMNSKLMHLSPYRTIK